MMNRNDNLPLQEEELFHYVLFADSRDALKRYVIVLAISISCLIVSLVVLFGLDVPEFEQYKPYWGVFGAFTLASAFHVWKKYRFMCWLISKMISSGYSVERMQANATQIIETRQQFEKEKQRLRS
jgi:hypothetical protein